MTVLEQMGSKAKAASKVLAGLKSEKDHALKAAAKALIEQQFKILQANKKDLEQARKNGIQNAMIDRLSLSEERIAGMADAMIEVAKAQDPVGKILGGEIRPNGLKIQKVSVPMGVIGIIYESRPNVTSDAASLCLKSGNAVILRGGKEAFHSNMAITAILREAISESGLPQDCIQLVLDTSRESVTELMQMTDCLDLLFPRGGAGLIKAVKEQSKVPVIETGVGNCHVYVDEFADLQMATDIIFNAKTSRPSVCNTIETVLVHSRIAEKALPMIQQKLDEKQVEIRADKKTRAIIQNCKVATESDWETEFLDYILAVKVVESLEEAVDHIEKYSSKHSEAIITENVHNAEQFLNSVDSAAVYLNASTRYTDGGEFGLGAEIGISTQKLHARGPMGLGQLTSYKFIITGNGQVRS